MAKGSILGPLLFVMFIIDLPLQVQTRINMFADDTIFMASSNYGNVKKLENTLSFAVSLRNGMWHGLRNGMWHGLRNVKYGNWRK